MSKDNLNAEEKKSEVRVSIIGKINVEALEILSKLDNFHHITVNIQDIKINNIDELMTLNNVKIEGFSAVFLNIAKHKNSCKDMDKSQISVKILDSICEGHYTRFIADVLEHMMYNKNLYELPLDEQAAKILKLFQPKGGEKVENDEFKKVLSTLSKWGNAATKTLCTNILSNNQPSHAEKELQRRQQGNTFSMNKW